MRKRQRRRSSGPADETAAAESNRTEFPNSGDFESARPKREIQAGKEEVAHRGTNREVPQTTLRNELEAKEEEKVCGEERPTIFARYTVCGAIPKEERSEKRNPSGQNPRFVSANHQHSECGNREIKRKSHWVAEKNREKTRCDVRAEHSQNRNEPTVPPNRRGGQKNRDAAAPRETAPLRNQFVQLARTVRREIKYARTSRQKRLTEEIEGRAPEIKPGAYIRRPETSFRESAFRADHP